jgi:hypothetical protein
MLTMWAWAAFSTGFEADRTRFLLAFMLTWALGGGLLAMLFSSAGPCFYADLYPGAPNPYGPLSDYVGSIHTALGGHVSGLQRVVWKAYATNDQDVIAGISAMPSMHNATSLLFALAAWRANRAAGIAMSVFAGLVFLGSVHLGWHYAIDAYFGWLVALACWWGAGVAARRWHALGVSRAYAGRLVAQSK